MTASTNASKNISMDVPGVFFIDKEGDRTCPICLDSIQQNNNSSILSCGHSYHSSCLFASAVNGINSCALCRKTVGNKPESRPNLTPPLSRIFIQNEFNQMGLGKIMDNFCKNISPETTRAWSSMSSEERLEKSGELIHIISQFGLRMNRQIANWINEGDERMYIPEEAPIEPFTFPQWSFSTTNITNDTLNYDSDDGEYDDMPALISDDMNNEYNYYLEMEIKAIIIQKIFRGVIARNKYNSPKMLLLRYKYWIKIKCDEVLQPLFEENNVHNYLDYAKRIQKIWRGRNIRIRFNIAKEMDDNYIKTMNSNSTLSYYRSLMGFNFIQFVNGDMTYDKYRIYHSNVISMNLPDSFNSFQVNPFTDARSLIVRMAFFRLLIERATIIQSAWRGYSIRNIKNLQNTLSSTDNNNISLISDISSNGWDIDSNTFDNTVFNMSWNDINADLQNYSNLNTFINNTDLSQDIVNRLRNSDFLMDYNNLMSCQIEDIMWPQGGSGSRPLFSRQEAELIFGEIIQHMANQAWPEIYEQLD